MTFLFLSPWLAWLLIAAVFGLTGYRMADFARRVQDDPQAARI